MDNERASPWVTVSAIAVIVSMATLVHAYLLVKLLLMAVFLVAATIEFVVRRNAGKKCSSASG